VENYLEANLTRNSAETSDAEWATVQKLIESPWFGENMGEYAVKVRTTHLDEVYHCP